MSTNRVRSNAEFGLRVLVYAIGVALTAYTLYYAYERPIVRVRHSNVFLGAGVALFYLTVARKKLADDAGPDGADANTPGARLRAIADRVDPLVCVLLAVVAVVSAVYVERNFARLLDDALIVGYTDVDILVGGVVVVLVTDATRRAYGWAISVFTMAAIGYALAGPWMPGFLSHTGMTFADVARYGAVGLTGVYGFILGVGATWVAIFIMFAGIAKEFGALDYVLGVGEEVGSNLSSGVVQVGVVASMIMGSITGSAAANTATTGSFTIPMMKDQGVRSDYAGAIESVASSGGQMMPPVMGVAAFIMADILQVPYVRVLQAGVLPALLFYFSVGVSVQLVVHKFGWTTQKEGSFGTGSLLKVLYVLVPGGVFVAALQAARLSASLAFVAAAVALLATVYLRAFVADGPSSDTTRATTRGILTTFVSGGFYAVPLSVLLVTLVALRLTPLSAGLYTTVAMIATLYLRNVTAAAAGLGDELNDDALAVSDSVPRALRDSTVATVRGFKQGAVEMAPLVGVLAAMGVIITMLTQTGLSQKISFRMVALGGGVLVVVLVLAMISSILFGLGMPTPAAYILVVILVAPALTELNVPDITAHFFVFYFAMLSAITPPVAVAVAVGSRIADSSFMTTGKQALRIGAAGFLIPFAFVTNEALIFWSFPATVLAAVAVFVGVLLLSVAAIGYDGVKDLPPSVRVGYLALSVTALYAPALEMVTGSAVAQGLQLVAVAAGVAALTLAHQREVPVVADAPRDT